MNEPAASEVQAALSRISGSSSFLRSRQLQRMLRFLVEETLGGRSDRLKEYVVGLEVFDRPDSYDPRLDSIVRVEARRLRAALNQYYANEGSSDPIIIELPKGSYVTKFRFRHQVPSADPRPSRVPFSRGTIWTAVAVGLLIGLPAAFLFWHTPKNRANLPPNATIAVLQFDNLSNVAENEYFCFALTDEITTQLAKAGGLRVVARTSAARFKRGDDIADIARQLRVDVVLEGSVRLSEGRLLVSAQLIDAADGIHIWSEMYERPGADQIRVQDEIAQAVARAVRRQLAGNGGKTPLQVRYSPDADANLLYWKGIYLRTPMGNTNWRGDLLKSADYLERAAQRDSSFARAYAALADVYVSLAWERGGGLITRDFMMRGERAARRAIELDSTLAEAHGALGTIQFFYNHDPAASEKSFERALQSNPSNGKARMWYAYALVMQRRFDQALAQARQAEELDPLSYVSTTHLAVVNYFSRRYAEALKLVSETMDVAQSAPAHGLRGMILETQGKYDEAIAEYQAGLRLVPTHSYIKGMLGHAYAMSGRAAEAKRLLKDVNLEFERGGLSDLKAAYIYLALGDRDQALRHLELDYEQGDPELPYINVDPVFDPVRSDPRFLALLKKLGVAGQAGPNGGGGTRGNGQPGV